MRRADLRQGIKDLFAKHAKDVDIDEAGKQAIENGLIEYLRLIVPDKYIVVFNNDAPLKVCLTSKQAETEIKCQQGNEDARRARYGASLGMPAYFHTHEVPLSWEDLD